jgi:autoinducer 2 (AI-2) kinase
MNPHCANGLYQAEAISFFTGLIMRWFRDAFCDSEKQIAAARGIDTYALLEEMASSVPVGSNGIMPIFSDVMKYGKWYHAAPSFINLSIDAEKCNKASMFRALEENAAIVSAINLENIEKFSGVKNNSIIFAAGASKGFLWPQIVADATKKEIKIPVVKEATSLGCAMYAGVATGVFKDIKEASEEIVKIEKIFIPNKENSKIYDELKEKWLEIYSSQLKLVDRDLTTSMWKAPGI